MAYASVGDAKHSANNSNVKTISGNVQRPQHWWQRKQKPQAAPVERSPFSNPAGDTEILPQVQIKPVTPPVLYRERPADLDKAACNITLAATASRLHGWSAIKLEEQLAVHMRVVHGLAEQERAEGRKLLARNGNGPQAARLIAENLGEIVSAEQKANELPGVTVKAAIDTGALGSELTAVTANAHDLSDATMTFQPITPDMADPRVRVSVATVTVDGPASPVHVPGDGTTPPLPDDADETADPGARKPLPKRVPHPLTSFPARMNTDGTPIDGTSALAGDLPGAKPGAWLLDENNTWSLITDAVLDTDGKRVTTNLAKGLTVSPRCDVRVWLLAADEARRLRSVHEVEMDALECERAGDAA